jgi:hypothetical protein
VSALDTSLTLMVLDLAMANLTCNGAGTARPTRLCGRT